MTFNQLISRINLFFRSRPESAFFVGGFVRDFLLGRRVKDIDLVICGEVFKIAEDLAGELGATSFPLKKEMGIARIACDNFTIDLSVLRGKDIFDDLKGRDFTINSIAIPLPFDVKNPKIIDPFNGEHDLLKKILVQLNDEIFDDDPVRLIRAVRIASETGFTIDKSLYELMKANSKMIGRTSWERIATEFLIMARSREFSQSVELLSELDLLNEIAPELSGLKETAQDGYHHSDAWSHTIETVKNIDRINLDIGRYFPDSVELIEGLLATELQFGVDILSALRVAALFHDFGKPECRSVDEKGVHFYGHNEVGQSKVLAFCRRLKLGSNLCRFLGDMVFYHLYLAILAAQPGVTDRAKYRYLRRVGELAVPLSLLSIADGMASRGPRSTEVYARKHRQLARQMVTEFFGSGRIIKQKPLLTGDAVMSIFGIGQGPRVGEILNWIAEERAAGIIDSQEKAIDSAAREFGLEIKRLN